MATHARVLDRRRFELLIGDGDVDAVLAAVDGYRNPDGGYGWGIEPDLRAPESQPAGALHAFEVFLDVAPVVTPRAVELCDWLASVSLPDGGLPFALPVRDSSGLAPFWAQADPTISALQSTSFAVGNALRIAAYDGAVAKHPWLDQATTYCFTAIEKLTDSPHAIELLFAIGFLDAVSDTHPEAIEILESLRRFIPSDGILPVEGGSEGEVIRPLDVAPTPGRPARKLYDEAVVDAELSRLAAAQQDDGGWRVDFDSYSPAAALEWRGYRTVSAVSILKDLTPDARRTT